MCPDPFDFAGGGLFLSFLLGRYRVSALQTARLLADRALSGVSRGHLRLAPTWTPEEASVVIQIRLPRICAAALIGAVCALITACGVYLGKTLARLCALNGWAELLGGLTLLAVACNILREHHVFD